MHAFDWSAAIVVVMMKMTIAETVQLLFCESYDEHIVNRMLTLVC